MFIKCSRVYQKSTGTLSLNRKVVEAYRDPVTKKPSNRVVRTLEKLPILERSRLIQQYGGSKYLRAEEWKALEDAGDLKAPKVEAKVGDLYSGGGSAVAHYHFMQSGLREILKTHLPKNTYKVIEELILHQITNSSSKSHFIKSRKHEYLYGLNGRPKRSESSVYNAMDNLQAQFQNIRDSLNGFTQSQDLVLLYDLSNSYFCGKKAELGGRGDSKEKRHDRYIVTYGLVTDQNGKPIDIKVWKGGTADSKTVKAQFTDWKKHYKAKKGIWIADRSMSGEENTSDIKALGLDYITGVPGASQMAILKAQSETNPTLFDQTNLGEFEYQDRRYVICKHVSKGYRRERQYYKSRRKVYEELLKIQKTPQNKNKEKIYHRAMKALEKHEQTAFWEIKVVDLEKDNPKDQQRYRLEFKLNRKQVQAYNKLGHYYLLHTSLSKSKASPKQVQNNYKSLHRVEACFRNLKSSLDIRPIRHWKGRRIKAHIYLSYLSLWLLKYIEHKWRAAKITSDVKMTLSDWNRGLLLSQLLDKDNKQISLKWNSGENAMQIIEQIKKYDEFAAIKNLI